MITAPANRPSRWLGWGVLGGLITLAGVWTSGLLAQTPAVTAPPPVAVDTKLQLIGSLSSRHVYTLFGYIGVVADSAFQGTASTENVDAMMTEVGVMVDELSIELKGLQKADLTAEDTAAVTEILEIYQLLKEEADAVRVYARNKTEANGGAFQKKRTEVWPRIAKVVGLPANAK